MAHVFITGSADGLGRATAATLLDEGHKVVVHARSTATGGYWYHQRRRDPHPAARRAGFQDKLLGALGELTGAVIR
ncbi:SDR family NAD(P)-dependent oxidoreductase [Actinoplanes sp. NPDC049596]|uniref:SDR family NAD(P)-dependent oxidoreductase n=1 Tax=unclassified Actinoplanes TaxID=2626549 RepID=UPI00343D2F1C